MAEWQRTGGRVEPAARIPLRTGRRVVDWIDALAARTVGELLTAWVGMVAVCGVVYWIAGAWLGGGLLAQGSLVPATARGLLTAIYFSFVTATSVGYGDVVPVGALRGLAIAEAAAGLLIFGFLISRFVSRHQEETLDEIHRIAFEDRLGRVQTNLHLVLSDLQAVRADCTAGAIPPPNALARTESTAMVLASQLRSIHDLLFRPQQTPDETVLEALLANLASAFLELRDLLSCLPEERLSAPALRGSLRTIARLGVEICGDCVPRAYAANLREWMDRIQEAARRLPS